MFRRKIYLLLLVAVLACTAQGQFISSVVRTGNSTQPAPTLAPNPMDEDELTFNDRTHQWNDVPLEMVDAQYVLTSNSDKTTTQYTLTVTMEQSATLYVIIDNRCGGGTGGKDFDPTLPASMGWVTDLGFVDTGMDIGIDENGDGSIDQYSSIFEKGVTTGAVIELGAQNDGGGRNNYGVAALGPKLFAYDPTPPNGEEVTTTYKTLGWTAGATAASHDVYFGVNHDDVANGTGGAFQGNQTGKYFIVGFAPYAVPEGLLPGTTYYWRVDEVEADGVTKYTGKVWSFSVPYQIATEPDPADGASYISADVDLSWEAGFESMIHYVYFGDDYDTVANATTGGIPTPVATFNPSDTLGELEKDKTYYWRIDEQSAGGLHTGEVWTFTTAPVIPITDPNLLVWYKFDEGSGSVAPDWSGYDHHAAIHGASWVEEGQVGGAIEFGGDGDYTEYPDGSFMNGLSAITISAWIKSDVINTDKGFITLTNIDATDNRDIRYDSDGGNSGRDDVIKCGVYTTAGTDASAGGAQEVESTGGIQVTEWQHVALVWTSGQNVRLYVNSVLNDGYLLASQVTRAGTLSGYTKILVGVASKDTLGSAGWDGLVDDVRIYDKALTQEDIQQVMRGEPDLAWNPQPGSGVIAQIADVGQMSWSAGDFAAQHDVYFGTNKDAVKNANTGSPEYKGRRASTTYSLAGLVAFGTGPYYWRIDEINNDSSISTGRVWKFDIAGYIVIDEFEDYNDEPPDRVFETWLDGFGGTTNGSIAGYPYPVFADGDHFCETDITHGGRQSGPMFYSGFSEITRTLPDDVRDWTQYGVKSMSLWYYGHLPTHGSLVQGPVGTYTMTGAGADIWNTEDQFHFAWKTLGSGAVEIVAKVGAITGSGLNEWAKAGIMIRETLDANSINVFVGISNTQGITFQYRVDTEGASANVQMAGVSDRPQWLKLTKNLAGTFTAYHANDVGGSPGTWEQVAAYELQMNSPAYIGLALTSHQAGVPAEVVFSNITTTGAVTGATFMSQDIGIQSNARANMYVKIKDSTGQMATVINPDPNAANVTSWTEWPLALTEFTTLNPSLNMLNIDSMTIGFQPGGSGLMFFDDVRLYPPRYISGYGTPLAIDFNNDGIVNYGDLDVMVGDWLKSDAEIATAVPGAANALWKFENNLSNSAGSGNGVAQGAVAYSAGAFGNALDLSTSSSYVTVADNPSVEFGAGSFSISVWIKDDFVANDPKEFVLCNGTNSSEFTGASGNRYALKFEGAGDFRFVIDDNVTKTIVNGNSDEFATGDWVHAAAVRDADAAELRIYCNGALANTQANVTTGDISSPGEGLYIGAKLQENAGAANLASTPIDHYYGGMMDELALYGRVLTDAEIAYLADTTPGDGTLYVPLTSAVNIVTKVGDAGVYNPANPDVVNFVDYAELLNHWLEEQLWPEP